MMSCLKASFPFSDVFKTIPIGSMYGIFPYIELIFMVKVGEYTSPMDPMGLELDFFALGMTPPMGPEGVLLPVDLPGIPGVVEDFVGEKPSWNQSRKHFVLSESDIDL